MNPDMATPNPLHKFRLAARVIETRLPVGAKLFYPPIPPGAYRGTLRDLRDFIAGATRWRVLSKCSDGTAFIVRMSHE